MVLGEKHKGGCFGPVESPFHDVSDLEASRTLVEMNGERIGKGLPPKFLRLLIEEVLGVEPTVRVE